MKPKFLDIDPINTDVDGIAESQQPASGGSQSLALDGALADLGTAGVFNIADAGYSDGISGVKIGITSAGNDTGRTFTVTGTNYLDIATTESITGANADIAEGTEYWAEITSITVDNDTASTVTVGTVDEVVSRVIPVNWRSDDFSLGLSIDITGTINYTIQHCLTDIQDRTITQKWFNHDTLASQTTDQDGNYVIPFRAVRLIVNSYSSGAEIAFNIVHGG